MHLALIDSSRTPPAEEGADHKNIRQCRAVHGIPSPLRSGLFRKNRRLVARLVVSEKRLHTARDLQVSQVIRYVIKPPDDLCVAETSCGGIAGATEGNGSDVTFATRQYVRTHHCGIWTEAFDRLAGSQTVIGRNEGQSDEVGDFRHVDPGLWMHVDNSFRVDRARWMFLFCSIEVNPCPGPERSLGDRLSRAWARFRRNVNGGHL
jgi:hypothetical protein